MKKLMAVLLASVVLGLSVQSYAASKSGSRSERAATSHVQIKQEDGKVNLNTADAASLAKAVKGIGPKRAEAIVAYREQHGAFESIDDLANVHGIGKKFIARNGDALKQALTLK